MAFQVVSQNYLDILTAGQLSHYFRIPLTWFRLGFATVSPNNLALYSNDLNSLAFSISLSKLVVSFLE